MNKQKQKVRQQRRKPTRRPRPRWRGPAPPRVSALIRRELDKAHHRIDMGAAGVYFADVMLDPLGQGSGKGPKTLPGGCPDGAARMGRLVVTTRATWPGATATSGTISMMVPNANHGGGLMYCYGNDANDPTASPTAQVILNWRENTALEAILQEGVRFRIISAGLRAISISADDNNDGVLTGAVVNTPGASGAAAYRTYLTTHTGVIEETRTVKEGMTVRMPFDQNNLDLNTLAADQYSSYPQFGTLPAMIFVGLSATGSLQVESVMHIEVEVTNLVPIPVQPSQYEPELRHIIQYANTQELVVSGRSFWSFLKKVATGVGKVFGFVKRQAAHISPIIHAISPKVGDIADRVLAF